MVGVLSSTYLLIFGDQLVTCDLIAYTNNEYELDSSRLLFYYFQLFFFIHLIFLFSKRIQLEN